MSELQSPFKVGDEVVYIDGHFDSSDHVMVTITGETATTYRAGKLIFQKQAWGDPKGRGDVWGYIRPVTPERLERVEATIARKQEALRQKANDQACRESDEAEYLAWIETPEGKAMMLLQSDWIGAIITTERRDHSYGRYIIFHLTEPSGRELTSIRVEQKTDSDFQRDIESLARCEVTFSSHRMTSGQAKRFGEMMEMAAALAEEWDRYMGKAWKYDHATQTATIEVSI